MEKENEIISTDIVEVQSVSVTEAQSRAEIDIQISTANRFPRNVDRAIQNIIAIVSKDKELAEKCIYSLPRGGKEVKGVSVHLARLIASEYKNMRVQCCIVEIGNTTVTAQATAHDVQTNYAVRTEVKRKITDKRGQRYNEDMVVMTCNAALAVAERNAILKVIPITIVNKVYKSAQNAILGDLTNEEKLIKRRLEVIEGFKTWNVSEQEILDLLGLESISQIKQEQILTLVGLANAINDGDTTVKEAFGKEAKNTPTTEDTKKKVQEVIKKAKEKRSARQHASAPAPQGDAPIFVPFGNGEISSLT